jgi:hypothetical protein
LRGKGMEVQYPINRDLDRFSIHFWPIH